VLHPKLERVLLIDVSRGILEMSDIVHIGPGWPLLPADARKCQRPTSFVSNYSGW